MFGVRLLVHVLREVSVIVRELELDFLRPCRAGEYENEGESESLVGRITLQARETRDGSRARDFARVLENVLARELDSPGAREDEVSILNSSQQAQS